jgi:hypothetical protein
MHKNWNILVSTSILIGRAGQRKVGKAEPVLP